MRVVERIPKKDVQALSREPPAPRRLWKAPDEVLRRRIERAAEGGLGAARERAQRDLREKILRGRNDPPRALSPDRRRPYRENGDMFLDGGDQRERGAPSFQFHHFSFSGSCLPGLA